MSKFIVDAMDSYTRRRSAAVILRNPGGAIDMGSATCISIGSRLLLATAGHNLGTNETIQIVPPNTTISESLPLLRRGVDKQHDIGWIEVSSEAAARAGLTFLDVEHLVVDENPTDEGLYLIQGLPATWATVKQEGTIALASMGFMTIPVDLENLPYDVNTTSTLILDYSEALSPLPDPRGISGGGVWSIQTDLERLVWAPERAKLVGIVRSWRQREHHVLAAKAGLWLKLLAAHYPDLRHEIHYALSTQ